MKSPIRFMALAALFTLLPTIRGAVAQDWPQWRGPNRDAKATGFQAPATWPATLTKKWDVPVGDGVANPSLAGDHLYVFSREGGNEVIRCLNAATGQEVWGKSYPAEQVQGGDSGFPGPRSTPTVSNGKVVALGVQGMLTCWNAADGSEAWKKDEFVGNVPQFHTSSSPIIVDGLCIAQLGGQQGAMVAYDLASGEEKWRAPGGGAAHGSPALMTVDGMKVVIAPSASSLVAVNAANGKVVWQIQYRHGNYNAVTPIVDGQTLIVGGPGAGVGLTAWKLSKQGEELKEEQVWQYSDNPLNFNTPVVKDGDLYGLSSRDQLFCVKIEAGQATTGWATPIAAPAAVGQLPIIGQTLFAQPQPEQGRGEGRGQGRGEGRGQGGGRRGGRGGGGGRPGYGSVVDAGTVLMALSPAADLVIFKPSDAEFNQVARYKVSEQGRTYSHPILSGNRIYVKDADSVALFTVE